MDEKYEANDERKAKEMIPCQEIKCLKFPVCKSRKSIFCNILYEFLYSKIQNQTEVYSIFKNLIDCYRDHLTNNQTKNKAPIINSDRLTAQLDKGITHHE